MSLGVKERILTIRLMEKVRRLSSMCESVDILVKKEPRGYPKGNVEVPVR